MLTKREAEAEFRETILPEIRKVELQRGRWMDRPMRREEWNNYVDALAQDRRITATRRTRGRTPRFAGAEHRTVALSPERASAC